jgi:hypothetical protein
MDRLIIQTGFGPLYLTGRIHTDVRRPALLAMGGIWTPDDFLHELAETFPDHSVVIAPLPGMGGSLTRTFEVASLTRSLDEAIGWLFRDLRVVAYGVSTGALVTLGLQAPQVVRHVALEPFFRTAPLWPFHKTARDFLADDPNNRGARLAAEQIFGLTSSSLEDRDYRGLLQGLRKPLDVILADQPLEPARPVVRTPSLTSREDRAALAAHPLVTLHPGPAGSGHDLSAMPAGAALVTRVLRRALLAAAED